MPDLVKTRAQVLQNVYAFYNYLNGNQEEQQFACKLLKLGWVFVAEQVAGEILFAPSKFAGYYQNSKEKYYQNKEEGADGRESSMQMAAFYGKERPDINLLEVFKAFLQRYDVERNFDTEKNIKFLFKEQEVFDALHAAYFFSPTHLSGKKKEAWLSFLNKGIAAIGWDIGAHEGRSWSDIENEIKSRNYGNQSEAISAHKMLSQIRPGDIIACTNVNHGLFGIGVAMSKSQYEYGIHHLGNEEEEDGYHHYIEVAWLLTETIPKSSIANAKQESWWEPYGTLSTKSPAPDYIKQLLLHQPSTQPISATNSMAVTSPLNTILYGPPGTGKTYHTIVKAAEIISGQSFAAPDQYDDAKALFRQHLGEQVEFVTFHQNYSYEDFVAGLRPDTRPDNGGLQFKEHRGIFYRLCQKARQNWEQHLSGQTYIEPSFDEVLEAFLQPLYDEQEIPIDTLAYGKTFHITGNNNNVNLSFRKHSGGTAHTLSINTLRDLYEGKRTYNPGGLGVYYSPLVQSLKTKAATMRKETGKVPLKNYVLVIDEINRANISRVFGELITLLEEDKRLGAEHELRLRLPGLPDGELFGVPPNLYLVGTMNTADKSIALIDIALRRRFVFEDKYPRPETVQQVLTAPYDAYLLKLNEAIRQLKGPDFMIGHAYLIGKTDTPQAVAAVFNQKIIPLLNEYFYNQRNTSVYGLLTGTGISLPGVQFEQDDFIGAKAGV